MKLSIVTINYNNAEGLRKTLASVAEQTYRDIEHIVIDGGSTDGSVDIIKDYVNQCLMYDVLWVSEKDSGIYNAMNKGIRKATGDYIQILNSGDILAGPDVTAKMIVALNDEMSRDKSLNDGVPILYGNIMKDYGNGKLVRDMSGNGLYNPSSFLYFYFGTLNHDSAYIRRDLFDKYGLYNEKMKICSDWEWYVRALVLGNVRAVYTNIDVTIFEMNGVSESVGKNVELIKKERREYLEKILPPAVLRDYDMYAFPIDQYMRLKKHHLWGLVWFTERVVRRLEKWGILR